jgi:hypothetical protein
LNVSADFRPKSTKLSSLYDIFEFSDEEIAKQITIEQFQLFHKIEVTIQSENGRSTSTS